MANIVYRYRQNYHGASTELQKTAQRIMRKESICGIGSYEAVNWYGVVIDVRSTKEGKAGLSVNAGEFKLVPFDGFFGDSNFVDSTSPIYQSLLSLKKGDKVAFHGVFHKSDKDCFREMSLTENGSMTSPDFIFDFKAVIPYH